MRLSAGIILLTGLIAVIYSCTGGGGEITSEDIVIDAPFYAKVSSMPDSMFIADSVWVEIDDVDPPERWMVHVQAWNGDCSQFLEFFLMGIELPGEININSTLIYGSANWHDNGEQFTTLNGGYGHVSVAEFVEYNHLKGNFQFQVKKPGTSEIVDITEGFFDTDVDEGFLN